MAKTTKAAAPRKPAGEARAAAPRRNVSEQTEAPFGTSLGSGNGSARAEVSDEELRGLIAETAYFKAQQRGFAPGYEQRDWLEAEAEVMNRLGMRS